MRHGTHSITRAVEALLLVLFIAGAARGQLTTPLHIVALNPIRDELGHVLDGDAKSPGDCVQILRASDGMVLPPMPNGEPHPMNPVIAGGTAAIGRGAPRSYDRPGNFGLSIAKDRPSGKIFVRVFNAKDPGEANFYGDSQVFSVSGNATFIVDIDQTDQPMDGADNDLDGVVNSWEESLGLDENNPDTDGDGMKDGDEFKAGTDPMNGSSRLEIQTARVARSMDRGPGDQDFILGWPSVAGKQYRIEYSAQPLSGGVTWTEVGETITATSSWTEYTVSGGARDKRGVYRIRLVE